jgi:hypothetical protein
MEITFEVFEAQFMSTLGGFIPVYAAKYEVVIACMWGFFVLLLLVGCIRIDADRSIGRKHNCHLFRSQSDINKDHER